MKNNEKFMPLNIQRFGTPKLSTLSTLYYSEKEYPTIEELIHVMYTQEIPELEEAPEAMAYQTTDMAEEHSEQGDKKVTQPVIPILYTREQHKSLQELSDSKKIVYWFLKYPDSTCDIENGEEPLVKSFSGSCSLTGAGITVGELLSDNLTLYRNSGIKETYGFPKAPTGD